MPFAGEGGFFSPDSVLSHCYGALLPMFDTKEATVLRQLCREFKGTVAEFPWEDEKTVIRGSVAAWRACFSRARWANVREYSHFGDEGRRTPVVDADQGECGSMEKVLSQGQVGECEKVWSGLPLEPRGGCGLCAFCGTEEVEHEYVQKCH